MKHGLLQGYNNVDQGTVLRDNGQLMVKAKVTYARILNFVDLGVRARTCFSQVLGQAGQDMCGWFS